jgi:UDP-N-acetylmuramate--alanine ligase
MHIYFSGVGGAGIGPLALVAHQAGYEVSGSDKQDSSYLPYLREHGVTEVGVDVGADHLQRVHSAKAVDWVVYSSALPKENPDHPVLKFAETAGIKHTKRDEFLNHLLAEKNLKLIAIAGTHGKTTTTTMVIWLFKQLNIPISYAVGAKMSFGEMGEFNPASKYFVYECDEYDRNFLSFKPFFSIISGIDWDHPDIFPTRELYYQAFKHFLNQSEHALIWQEDADKLSIKSSDKIVVINKEDYPDFKLVGQVNRENAAIVAQSVMQVLEKGDLMPLKDILNGFPGLSRRFEKIVENIYSDYAHTPEKIKGALQTAHEVAGDNVVVVYEGLHNTRQHFIKDELTHLFDSAKKLYIVPSYRAREDMGLEDLSPEKLITLTSQPDKAEPAGLNDGLKQKIINHASHDDLVLCMSAGGGGSLDEWLRTQFKN